MLDMNQKDKYDVDACYNKALEIYKYILKEIEDNELVATFLWDFIYVELEDLK